MNYICKITIFYLYFICVKNQPIREQILTASRVFSGSQTIFASNCYKQQSASNVAKWKTYLGPLCGAKKKLNKKTFSILIQHKNSIFVLGAQWSILWANKSWSCHASFKWFIFIMAPALMFLIIVNIIFQSYIFKYKLIVN